MDAMELVTLKDLEIAVRIWHPEAPKTVIAWHGLARHGGDFENFARILGPEWRVLAPDTPGRGLSSWSPIQSHDYLYRSYMSVALAVLDHFELERAPWVGTSMGGLLGMLLAAEAESSHRIERLVLNDVGPELNPQGLMQLALYFGRPHRFTTFAQLQAELTEHYHGFGIEETKPGVDWHLAAQGVCLTAAGPTITIPASPNNSSTTHHATPGPTGERSTAR